MKTFEPKTSWLPSFTTPEDYTPEYCKALERIYWRTCGIGKPALYGADMPGSLFDEDTTQWNVANLPSLLSRLLPPNARMPGVNTPYLYFGMWRATFAWHVEDMDLFSINYIHWGVSNLHCPETVIDACDLGTQTLVCCPASTRQSFRRRNEEPLSGR